MPKRKTEAEIRREKAVRPRSPRTAVRLVAPARGMGGAATDLEILNISTTGMLLRHPSANDGWTAAEVQLPNGKSIVGSVSWRDEDLVGFKFDSAISKADIAAVALKGEPMGSASRRGILQLPEKDIMSKLSEIRAAAGLSIEEIAGKIGVSRQAVWYWEQGRSVPRPAAMRALRRVLDDVARGASDPDSPSHATFGDRVARLKHELAEHLGIESSSIRIIVEQ